MKSQTEFGLTDLVDSVPVGPEFDGFAVFAVGGAVRDALRGVRPADVDLMAVPRNGQVSDPVAVLRDRMKFVDPDSTIPVFVDSHGREVALPRTEQSSGEGHTNFAMSVVPVDMPVDKTVKTDLHRRDLTVNAMAMNARSGKLVDPFGGVDDLQGGVLRHVSEAFVDDALRVVRLARFVARLDGRVAPETMELARSISEQVANVPVERVTKEFRKVVKQADDAGRFFQVLADVDALAVTFPVVADHDVDAVAQAVNDTHTGDDRFTAVMAALGDLLGTDADRFAQSGDLFNQEVASLKMGRELLGDVARFDSLNDRKAVAVFGRLNSDRGGSLSAFVAAADARHDMDVNAVRNRLSATSDVFDTVTGRSVMESEGVTPGVDIDGGEFGNLLAQHRADAL